MNAITSYMVSDKWSMPSPKIGPYSRNRQNRALTVYALMLVLGALPALIGLSPALQTAGIGLWFPAASFLAVGGWALALIPVFLILFFLSIIGWFWAGANVAPIIAWALPIPVAVMMLRPEGVTSYGHWAALAVVGFVAVSVVLLRIRRDAKHQKTAETRAEFFEKSAATTRDIQANAKVDAAPELSEEQLEGVRYLYDRALQPMDSWNGYDLGDQFQPGGLRYQLNYMGYAFGLVKSTYAPSFTGYLQEAQTKATEKYLNRKVWSYWVYETMWGHLNFSNFDPAGRDNIMLTGWYGMQVGQHMLTSGDRKYSEPGSLTFKWNDKKIYRHSLPTILQSVVDNYQNYDSKFGLYSCEPNWIFPICNYFGMGALAVNDSLYGTKHVDAVLPKWMDRLEEEFLDRAGSVISLKSEALGIEFPFPKCEAGYSQLSNIFLPELAVRHWAISREEFIRQFRKDDMGNDYVAIDMLGKYKETPDPRLGAVIALGMGSAAEMGDREVYDALQNTMDRNATKTVRDGSRNYAEVNNMYNGALVLAQVTTPNAFRNSFLRPTPAAQLNGPILARAQYPAVQVARAFGEGDTLDLVLYPGGSGSTESIGLAQLSPRTTYVAHFANGRTETLMSDARGNADLSVQLNGRTPIRIEKAPA